MKRNAFYNRRIMRAAMKQEFLGQLKTAYMFLPILAYHGTGTDGDRAPAHQKFRCCGFNEALELSYSI